MLVRIIIEGKVNVLCALLEYAGRNVDRKCPKVER